MAEQKHLFLAGGGETGRLIREFDWQSSPIGTPDHWPQALKTSLRLLLSTGHPIFVWWGPELIQFYNDAYSRSIGPERHPSAIGQRGRECWEEIWDIIGPQIEKVMAGKGYTWHENALVPITRYGRREDVYWTYSYSPIDDPGAATGVGGVLVVCSETTEQVQNEKRMREADQRKDEFLAMLGHELRNPLAPILSTSELLLQSDCHPRAQAFGALLLRQVGQLSHLVDDLLSVTRITENRIKLKRESTDLNTVIDLAIEAVQPVAEKNRQDIVVTDPDEPIYVFVDSTRIVQCITNILNNACKFTATGGLIEIEVGAAENFATIVVRDNGIGMTDETINNAFELFYQADQSLDRSAGGIGIGLSLAQRLIEMHGGSIEAESAGHGQGSTFAFRLPLAESEPMPAAAVRDDSGKPKRILIVDDNRDAADALAQILTLDGHNCEALYDGEQTIERFAEFAPDIMFIDIGLPGVDGYQLAQFIRRLNPGVRLIAITGYAQKSDVQLAHDAGFERHLAKPVDINTIRGVVRSRDD